MKRLLCLFLLLALFLSACGGNSRPAGTKPQDSDSGDAAQSPKIEMPPYVPNNPANMKAVWVSHWDLQRVYTKNGVQREREDFLLRASRMMQDAVTDGFNTVIVQVRPFGDSFYPSDFYPPAEMVVGAYGNEFTYDPFAILVEAAHKAGLSIHAWINPLRLMPTEDLERIPTSFPMRSWYDDSALRGQYLVLQGDGKWYLNPGYQEVRELIVRGAREIMERYDVDGLHLDDYFYPTTASDYDKACFAEYTSTGGDLSLGDFRRNSITLLVRALYDTVHEVKPEALFGIAPGGNLERAYASQYADVYAWCGEDRCVDYICPEIYFGFEHETCPFDKTADKWASIVTNGEVRLYLGISFHKAASGYDQYAGTGAYEWAQHADILLRSLQYAASMKRVSGVFVFSYQHFRNALTGQVPDYPREEREAFLPLLKTVVFRAAVSETDENT